LNTYLIILLAIVVIIIFAVNLGNNGLGTQAKHFDNGEISFDYPGALTEVNGTGSNITSFSDNSGLNITVVKERIPKGYNLANQVQSNGIGTVDENFQLVSTKNVTINGTTGYESDYKLQDGNVSKLRKEVWFQKNNAIYGIIYTGQGSAGSSGLDVSAAGDELNTIINSIKINDNVTNNNKVMGWAELIMPTIGGDWELTSHSVNDPGVYFVPTSYYPGTNGQTALMGHHTTHSAPFSGITQLKVGDPLIIKDYLTQKKYTYEVTSNGNDIRWGVKGVSIDYQSTSTPELWLITCWPTGYSRAAYIVHSKLVSVEPL
jgi:sortase A